MTEWMQYIPGYWQITQINLPGTHDAGTKIVDGGIYAKCQDWNIQEQLDHGIRFLDIRTNSAFEDYKPDAKTNPLILVHNFYPCYSDTEDGLLYLEKDVLPVCEKFVKDHPSEFIVFKITDEHVDGKTWVQEYLQQTLIPKLMEAGLYLVPEYDRLNQQRVTNTRAYTVSEARGHIVFLMNYTLTKYEDHYDDTDCDHRIDYYLKHCLETSIPMSLSSNDYFRKQSYENRDHDGNPDVRMFGMNNNAIGKGILTAISWFAWRINSWFEEQDLQQGMRYGWFFMDFPTETEIDHIIRTNPNIIGKTIYWAVTRDGTLHLSSSPYSGDASNLTAQGDFDDGLRFKNAEDVFWYKYRNKINSVVVDQEIEPLSLSYWFSNLAVCTSFDLANLSSNSAKTLDHMFLNCTSIKTLDLTNMSRDQLLKADEYDVTEMFANCTNLVTILASPNLNYTDIKKSTGMFRGDTKLVGREGTKCDGSDNLTQYAQVDGKDGKAGFFSTVATSDIYYGISDGTLYLSHHKDEKTPAVVNVKRPTWDGQGSSIRKVVVTEAIYPTTTLAWFENFRQCTSFDLTLMDLSKCIDMSEMFSGCSAVETLDLSGWARSKPCFQMFAGCSKLKTIYVDPGFSMSDQTKSHYIFEGCTSLVGQNGTKYDPAYDSHDYERAVIDGSGVGKPGYFTVKQGLYWGYDPNVRILYLGGYPDARTPNEFADQVYNYAPWYYSLPREPDNNDWPKVDAVKVITPMSPVNTAHWFYGLSGTKVFDLTLLDTSRTVNMRGMFENLKALEELNLTSFSSASLKEAREVFYQSTNLKTIYATKDFDLRDERINTGSFTNSKKLVGGLGTTDASKPHLKIDEVLSPGVFTEMKTPSTLYWGVDGNGQLIIGDAATPGVTDSFLDRARTSAEDIPWSDERITSVVIGAPIQPDYTDHWFDNSLGNYHITNFQLENLDTSRISDMTRMFAGNKDCPVLDLDNFDTPWKGYLKTIEMFADSGFETIVVSERFDLRGYITAMGRYMFLNCEKLVGGMGTAWKDTKVLDNSYGFYDGKGGKPGYFTQRKDLKYTVTFLNSDGTVLQSSKVPYKDMPKYTGPVPTRKPSDVYTYKFSGWEPMLTNVLGEQTYKAVYDVNPREYTAVYYAAETGEEVLDTVIFYYGDEPSTDKIPVKEHTQTKQYEFTLWKLESQKGDSYYYRPVFEEQEREYAVSFYDDDETGTTLLWMDFYHFGETPTYQGTTPTKKSDALYTYSFYGWSPLIHTVTDIPTPGMEDPNRYNAVYLQTPIQYHVISGDGGIYYKNYEGTQANLSFEIDTDWRNLNVDNPSEETKWIQLDGVCISSKPSIYVGLENKKSETDGQMHMVLTLKEDLMKIMNLGPHTVTLFYKNDTSVTAKFTIEDARPDHTLTVNIYKLIKDTEKSLGGARLTLTGQLLSGTGSEEIDYAVSWITPGEDSEQKYEQLFLTPGQYWLTEDDVPFGYKEADEIKFYITKDLVFGYGDMPETDPPAMLSMGTDGLTLSEEAEEEPEETAEETEPKEETPAAEETEVTEETPAAEETEVTEKVPAAEETELKEETPAAEETEVTEETPAVEETEIREETPAVEETEVREETPDNQKSAGEQEPLITEEPTETLMTSLTLGESPEDAPAPAEVKMSDEALPTLKVYFFKRDEAGASLDGAKLHLTSFDGKYSEQWTSSKEDRNLILPVGRYTLSEDEAPAGCKIAPCVQFEIGATESGYVYVHIIDPDGTVLAPETALGTELMASTKLSSVKMDSEFGYVAMYDVAKRASVSIRKTDSADQLLGNAAMQVKDAKDQTVASWISDAGKAHTLRLLPGNYTLIEDAAPEGYLKAAPISFTVTDTYQVKIGEEIVDAVTMVDNEIPKVTIAKVADDEVSGIHLAGAELKVTGSTIDVIHSWTTLPGVDEELSLLPGDYVLSEVTPPAGYLKAEDIAFTVTETYQVKIGDETLPDRTISMVDPEIPRTDVIFAKTDDADPANSLSGATLKVTGESIDYSTFWETETDQTKTLSLLPGDYTLSEVRTPGGYLPAADIRFRVKVNQTVWLLGTDEESKEETETAVTDRTITMVDKQAPKLTVTVVKTDGTASLSDAELRVDGTDVNFVDTWTTVAGEDHTMDLFAGTYVLNEDEAPDGYYKAEDITFRVKEVGEGEEKTLKLVLVGSDDSETEIDEVEMTDALIPTANVTLKFLNEAGASVGGAKLHVEGTDNPFYAEWTSEYGENKDLVLRVGSYRMVEDEAPEGYLPSESREFRVTAEGKLVVLLDDGETEAEYVEMTTSLIPTYPVAMTLVNEKGELLGGATLHAEDISGTVIASWSSTSAPMKELTLQPGRYRMVEDAAPKGYDKAAAIDFYVTNDGRIVVGDDAVEVEKIVMINRPTPPVQYLIIEGANSTWTHGSGTRHRFASNAPFAKFVSVEVDGKTVPSGCYTAYEGSTVVDFTAEYMESLALGKHSLRIVSSDGSASTEFTVAQGRIGPPLTGDESTVSVWLLLMALSAVGVFACAEATGKRKKEL